MTRGAVQAEEGVDLLLQRQRRDQRPAGILVAHLLAHLLRVLRCRARDRA